MRDVCRPTWPGRLVSISVKLVVCQNLSNFASASLLVHMIAKVATPSATNPVTNKSFLCLCSYCTFMDLQEYEICSIHNNTIVANNVSPCHIRSLFGKSNNNPKSLTPPPLHTNSKSKAQLGRVMLKRSDPVILRDESWYRCDLQTIRCRTDLQCSGSSELV